MNKDLMRAIQRLGYDPLDFPTTLVTGGSSDDCHGVGGGGTGFDRDAFDLSTGNEYDAKAVSIDLGDGRNIVFTTTFSDRSWDTHLALPPGCVVTGTILRPQT